MNEKERQKLWKKGQQQLNLSKYRLTKRQKQKVP